MMQAIAELQEAKIGEILSNEPMSRHTTWKVGGPADWMIIPRSKEQLVQAVRILHAHGIPWTKLGKGSNMLVSDKGIRGVVIKAGEREGLDYVRFEGARVIAGAAFSIVKLAYLTAKQGLSGMEFMGGIPGSVGGAVYMNAGAHGSDMSRIITTAEVLLETGELVKLTQQELEYAYRHSALHGKNAMVTEAEFELTPGDREEITAAMLGFRQRRLDTQPLQSASAGSVFRNPEGNFAARLIEQAGLKGRRVGGAEVSTQHANFIVNTGQATANDILTLMEQVKQTVLERYGVELVPEVLVVGEW